MARVRGRRVLEPVRGAGEFLVFGAPQIADAEVEEIVATMRSTWLGTGPRVARFEDLFRERTLARHALAVNSCTAALTACASSSCSVSGTSSPTTT